MEEHLTKIEITRNRGNSDANTKGFEIFNPSEMLKRAAKPIFPFFFADALSLNGLNVRACARFSPVKSWTFTIGKYNFKSKEKPLGIVHPLGRLSNMRSANYSAFGHFSRGHSLQRL